MLKNLSKNIKTIIKNRFLSVPFIRNLNEMRGLNVKVRNLQLAYKELAETHSNLIDEFQRMKEVSGHLINDVDWIKKIDYHFVNSFWRHYGGDELILTKLKFYSKSPLFWQVCHSEIWMIYLCVLLEKNKYAEAVYILNKYIMAFEAKDIHRYLPLAKFAKNNGVVNAEIEKAIYVYDCLVQNNQSRTLANLIEGKSIAIVGNGPSEIGMGKGSEIDSYDIVIRFNNYTTQGHEQDYGSKTTVWVRGSGGDDILDRVEVDQYNLVIWEADYDHFPIHFNNLDTLYDYLRQDKFKCINFDFESHLSLREFSGISFPTTGLVTIWTLYNLLEKSMAKISLFGFSFSNHQKDVLSTHYFEERSEDEVKKRTAVHDLSAEAKFIESLINL